MSGRLNGAGHLDGDLAAAEPNRIAMGLGGVALAAECVTMTDLAFRCLVGASGEGNQLRPWSGAHVQVYGGDENAGVRNERWTGAGWLCGYQDHPVLRPLASPGAAVTQRFPLFEDAGAGRECLGAYDYTERWPVQDEGVFRLVIGLPDPVEPHNHAWAPESAYRTGGHEASNSRLAATASSGAGDEASFMAFDNTGKAPRPLFVATGAGAAEIRGFDVRLGLTTFSENREAFDPTRALGVDLDVREREQVPESRVVCLGGTGALAVCRIAAAVQGDPFRACRSDGGLVAAAVRKMLERRSASDLFAVASRAAERIVMLDACSAFPVYPGSRDAFLLLGGPEPETPGWCRQAEAEFWNDFVVPSRYLVSRQVVVARAEELGALAGLSMPLTDATVAALDLWAQATRPDAAAVLLPVLLRVIAPALSARAQRCFLGRRHDTHRLECDALMGVLGEVMRGREAAAFAQVLERRIKRGLVWRSAREGLDGPAREVRGRGIHNAGRDRLWPLPYQRVGARAAMAVGQQVQVGAPAGASEVDERSRAELDVLEDPVVVEFTRGVAERTGSWVSALHAGLRSLFAAHRRPKSSPFPPEKPPARGRSFVIFIGHGVPAGGPAALALHRPRWLDRICRTVAQRDLVDDAWYAEPGGVRDYFDWALRPLSFGVTCSDDLAAEIAKRLRWVKLGGRDTEHAPTRFLAGLARRIAAFHVEMAQGRAAWSPPATHAQWITHDALVCSLLHEIPRVERDRLDGDLQRLGGLLPSFYMVLDGFDTGGRRRGARVEVLRGGNRDERALQWSYWLASTANVEVETRRSLELDACLIRTPGSATIYLGDHLPPREQEFAILHELAHLRLAHVPNTSYGLDPSRLDAAGTARFEGQEAEADALAVVYRRVVGALVAFVERDEKPSEPPRSAAATHLRDCDPVEVPGMSAPAAGSAACSST